MNNFGTLYCYEMKKILKRRLIWITVGIMLVLIVGNFSFRLMGNYYVDGVLVDTNYHMFQTDSAYQKALDGRKIDQALLEETFAGYARVPLNVENYSATEEYQLYARPYSEIFNFVRNTANMTFARARDWTPDEAQLYQMRREQVEQEWEEERLTEAEKDYWRKQELELEIPFVYAYKEAYSEMQYAFYTIGLLTLLTVAICLSNVFPEEHIRRTDQLVLSSRYGKKLYWAKILAGTVFCAGVSLLFSICALLTCFLIYGTKGFGAAFQLMYPDVPYHLSIGEAMLVAYGVMLVVAVFTGVFVMVFSEACRSNLATLGVVNGLIIVSMFVSLPPEKNQLLSQMWGYFPSEILSTWELFDSRLVPFLGGFLRKTQFAFLLYPVLSVLMTIPGKFAYKRQI